jgi:heat shock protein HslJ
MSRPVLRPTLLILLGAALLFVLAACISPTPAASPAQVEAASEAAAAAVAEGGGEVVADVAAAAFPLALTAWNLDSFGSAEAGSPLVPNTRASLLFFLDRYAGYDGCNWFLGVYNTTPAGGIRMFTPSSTRELCAPAERSDQAATYRLALVNVTNFEREGDQLRAFTVDNQQLLSFTAAEVVPAVGSEWELKFTWFADREQWAPVALGSRSTILFGEGGEASGSGGCSTFTAPYSGQLQSDMVEASVDGPSELPAISVGPLTIEAATCTEPNGIMEQESEFFTGLEAAAYYLRVGGVLIIVDENEAPLLLLSRD